MKKLITILLLCHSVLLNAQQNPTPEEDELNAAQLEDLTEADESEQEDDYTLQQLKSLSKDPADINSQEMNDFPLLDALLINNLTHYRQLLGDIIDVHELQAVPGFTTGIIKKILPYITAVNDKPTNANIKARLSKGDHSFLIRAATTPEIVQGFRDDASPSVHFNGSRPSLFFRYKYQYRNLLQFGFVTDKDAGERMFVNGPIPDFVSFHLFARRLGCIKSLAIGDYAINLGQGLIHWQSQAFRKSAAVINIKRQGDVLKPYQSAGEYNFHRGIAATLSKQKWECTLFASLRKLSANISTDSINGSVITSFQTSGLHRTSAELSDRNQTSLFTSGASIKRIHSSGHFAINSIYYRYALPVLKRDEPYNLFAMKGVSWFNASVDYSHTYRNFHLFGEAAIDKRNSRAIIQGVMASLSNAIDAAILYRNIARSYQSIYGNAFTESTMPSNEKGFYTGFSLRPFNIWKIDLYADLFSFPWLKYRLDVPASGLQYLVQITFKPSKQTELYSRFRYRMKPLNLVPEENDDEIPDVQIYQNWRSQLNFQLSRTILLRSRVEWCLYNHRYLSFPEDGHLFFTDVTIKPYGSWWSGNIRFMAFEAMSYETRIYAYENDVQFSSSTPSYYNNGVRYYINLKGKFKLKQLKNRELTVCLKAASTVYTNTSVIGSGPTSVLGHRLSSIKMQIFL